MKNILLAAMLIPAVLPAVATAGPEALKAGASLSFPNALPTGAAWRLTRMSVAQDGAESASPRTSQSRYIRLSGYLSLQGSGHIPQGSNGAFITVSGSTQLQDDRGRYLAGVVHFSDSSYYHVNGNYVSGWARPYAQISVYDNGRFLGSVRVDGTISVSGWNNGGWLNLSGSGQVSGSGYIQEPAPPQAP